MTDRAHLEEAARILRLTFRSADNPWGMVHRQDIEGLTALSAWLHADADAALASAPAAAPTPMVSWRCIACNGSGGECPSCGGTGERPVSPANQTPSLPRHGGPPEGFDPLPWRADGHMLLDAHGRIVAHMRPGTAGFVAAYCNHVTEPKPPAGQDTRVTCPQCKAAGRIAEDGLLHNYGASVAARGCICGGSGLVQPPQLMQLEASEPDHDTCSRCGGAVQNSGRDELCFECEERVAEAVSKLSEPPPDERTGSTCLRCGDKRTAENERGWCAVTPSANHDWQRADERAGALGAGIDWGEVIREDRAEIAAHGRTKVEAELEERAGGLVWNGFAAVQPAAEQGAGEREDLVESACWHCGDAIIIERPRCSRCPAECDDEGCAEPGCAASAGR